MYELHQNNGIYKFVIVVPSPAIKEGWKNFIQADSTKQHFSQYYENIKINLNVINAGDFNSKKGLMPSHLIDFIESDKINSSTIQVLLINASMLNSDTMRGKIQSGKNKGKERFNQTILSGYTRPLEAIKAIRPIVIIDEPHRFPRGGKYYESIEEISPQMIIRFGATFPYKKDVGGKKSRLIKDYYHKTPQFNLNAVSSFNNGLVKGIDIYYPNISESESKNKYIVKSAKKQKLTLKNGSNTYEYQVGDDLGFGGGIYYEGAKQLSTGLEVEEGMILLPATMTNSYQEMIIRDAIEKHFEAEIYNFMREYDHQVKVKTLSLFFIDSIKSYRDDEGWLKLCFERLLQTKVEKLIREYKIKTLPKEKEYLSFLQATHRNLKTNVHAGYFGVDRGDGDAGIQAEVDDILRNKEKLISFKNADGSWETRRFLFSKWTLREGWDNPNVFVIAKLRTSGSEISKIQEVGRGLRLPVDENGRRLTQEELPSRLRFLIGYDEKDFAKKLISEVNSDTSVILDKNRLTDEMIKMILMEEVDIDEEYLLKKLDEANIIKRNNDFKNGGFEKLLNHYPGLVDQSRVMEDKITTGGVKTKQHISLNKENWRKMHELWKKFSNRYMLEFKSKSTDSLQFLIDQVVGEKKNFVLQYPDFSKNEIYYSQEKKEMRFHEQAANYQILKANDGMKYGEFILKLSKSTKMKPSQLHKSLFRVVNEIYEGDTRYLNEITLSNVTRDFRDRFEEKYAQSYFYRELEFQASTSVFDVGKNDFKDEILASVIGVKEDEDVINDVRHLYKIPPLRYDSVYPEKELLKRGYDSSVITFGKLPKRAIQVPKYMGGTTTPDFIYIVEKKNQSFVYLLVETKAEGAAKRMSDQQVVDIQRSFFRGLKNIGVEYQEATTPEDVYSKLMEIMEYE